MKKNLLIFVGGILFTGLIYMLIIKPKDKELPTIWDTAAQEEVRRTEDRKIDVAEKKIETAKKKTRVNNEKRDKVFNNGLTDTERDSIGRSIQLKRRKADSIRAAEDL